MPEKNLDMPERIYVYEIKDLRREFGFVGRWVAIALKEVQPLVRKQFLLYLEKKGIKYAMCEIGLANWVLVVMVGDSRERRKVRSVLHYYGLVKYELTDWLWIDKKIEGMRFVMMLERGEDGYYR